MSTLRVSTLQDTAGSNSSTPSQIANGIAKAWVNFNGTGTVAIRASYNVSSITDNTTGDYTLNFATAFADTNYTPVFGSSSWTPTGGNGTLLGLYSGGAYTTTALRISTKVLNSPATPEDMPIALVAIFR